jgi:hypothetical protein
VRSWALTCHLTWLTPTPLATSLLMVSGNTTLRCGTMTEESMKRFAGRSLLIVFRKRVQRPRMPSSSKPLTTAKETTSRAPRFRRECLTIPTAPQASAMHAERRHLESLVVSRAQVRALRCFRAPRAPASQTLRSLARSRLDRWIPRLMKQAVSAAPFLKAAATKSGKLSAAVPHYSVNSKPARLALCSLIIFSLSLEPSIMPQTKHPPSPSSFRAKIPSPLKFQRL